MEFHGRVVLVTGAAGAIGKGVATDFAQKGASVFLTDLSQTAIDAVVAEIKAATGAPCTGLAADVTQEDQVIAVVEAAKQAFGGSIDVLINVAGCVAQGKIEEIDAAEWDKIFAVNCKGTFLFIKHVVPLMKSQQSGKIVNFSSKSGKTGSGLMAHYSAAKAAIIGLTQALAFELADCKINVNCVCPGITDNTGVWSSVSSGYVREMGMAKDEIVKKFTAKVPLGRLASIADVVAVTTFLASKGADYLTGQAINITGGREMPDKMQALVYHAPGDIRLETIDVPACGPGELRLRVDACAVCGTDLKTWHNGNPRIAAPRVMGHEFTGLVETVGEGVRGFAIGERVVMATSVSCGGCYYCKRGWNNLCAELAPMGFTYDGGMARYVTAPARAVRNGHVLKVPAGVSAVHAALAEPVSCAVNACEHCRIEPGDTVVVIGAGPMGIINACVAREFGAGRVIVSEVNAARRQQAAAFGFDRLVNPAAEDLSAIIQGMTSGLGADVVIVAAPAAAPLEQAPALVRKRGTVCLFASLPAGKSAITIDSRTIHYGEVWLVGTSDSTPAQVARAVELIAGGRLLVDRLASHVLGLDGLQQAYALMTSGEALRVVLIPEGD